MLFTILQELSAVVVRLMQQFDKPAETLPAKPSISCVIEALESVISQIPPANSQPIVSRLKCSHSFIASGYMYLNWFSVSMNRQLLKISLYSCSRQWSFGSCHMQFEINILLSRTFCHKMTTNQSEMGITVY